MRAARPTLLCLASLLLLSAGALARPKPPAEERGAETTPAKKGAAKPTAGQPAKKKDGPGALSDRQKRARIEALLRSYQKDLKGIPEVTVKEALALANERGARFVDARAPAERKVSTIKGAIPHEQVLAHPERYQDRPLIVYCTIGYRSGLMVRRLRKAGLEAYNLRGSLLSWVHAGQPLYHDDERTKRLHVYGETWDLAPRGIQTVW